MKTISQIRNKSRQLKARLQKKTVHENFGDKEQRLLDDFIGDTYGYDYNTRLSINGITNQFAEWCWDYTGN
jgi:hypothetical protein